MESIGWTDYRLTKFEQIEKWWEIIMSAYLMVSLNSKFFGDFNQSLLPSKDEPTDFSRHQQWNLTGVWKRTLNNLRLIIQPTILLWLIFPLFLIIPLYIFLWLFDNYLSSFHL